MRYTNNRRQKKKLQTTLQLMDIKEIDQNSIVTPDGQRVSFVLITPVNMGVLSEEVVSGRISALSNILTNAENLQILCLNASQSYEKNKEYLASQMKTETNEILSELDRKDMDYLDDIRISMATGREFALAVRFKRNMGRPQQEQALKRLLLLLLESGFTARIAEDQEIKGILAIYFAQDIYNDHWPDFDGEQFLSPADAKQEKSFFELIAPSIIDFRKLCFLQAEAGTFCRCLLFNPFHSWKKIMDATARKRSRSAVKILFLAASLPFHPLLTNYLRRSAIKRFYPAACQKAPALEQAGKETVKAFK